MKKCAGFTLVELLITVAVAAVLLAVAVPSFNNYLAAYRLTTLTNDLISAVHLTRSEAIRLNRNATLCRTAASVDTTCAAAGNAAWAHWISRHDTVSRSGSPANQGSAFSVTSTLTNDALSFGPSGLPANAGLLVACTTASIRENRREITIGPGNRVSMQRVTGNCP